MADHTGQVNASFHARLRHQSLRRVCLFEQLLRLCGQYATPLFLNSASPDVDVAPPCAGEITTDLLFSARAFQLHFDQVILRTGVQHQLFWRAADS
jgi:hypothetical protein